MSLQATLVGDGQENIDYASLRSEEDEHSRYSLTTDALLPPTSQASVSA